MSEQAVFDTLRYRIEVDCHGNRFYYNNAGLLHRTDGPAIVYADGGKAWFINGLLHRTDGHAVEYPEGSKAWFINGEELTENEFNQKAKLL